RQGVLRLCPRGSSENHRQPHNPCCQTAQAELLRVHARSSVFLNCHSMIRIMRLAGQGHSACGIATIFCTLRRKLSKSVFPQTNIPMRRMLSRLRRAGKYVVPRRPRYTNGNPIAQESRSSACYRSLSASPPLLPAGGGVFGTICGIPASFIFLFSAGRSSSAIFFTWV